MDNKFSKMDISKFDPTNASVDSVRKWLFAIIDAELDKDPEERDYGLIEECSECERELPTDGAGISEKELSVGLERIKAQVSKTEGQDIKIINTKKKSKKSVRVIVILAAVISTMLLSMTVAAISQGKSVGVFISENIQKIFNMDGGEKIKDENITLIKNGVMTSYSSLEQAVKAIGIDVLYPSYLPDGVKVERVVVTKSKEDEKVMVSYITNDTDLFIRITIDFDLINEVQDDLTLYRSAKMDFYIVSRDETAQAIGLYGENKYAIYYNDYDALLKILDGLEEIEK